MSLLQYTENEILRIYMNMENERLRLYIEYLESSRNVELWAKFDGTDASEELEKLYNRYKVEEAFLENMQSRLKKVLMDIEYYKENK